MYDSKTCGMGLLTGIDAHRSRVANEWHIVHKCLVLQSSEHAAVFTLNTDTIRSFFAKQDHMQVWSGLVIELIVLTAWNFDSSLICDN